MLLEKKNMSNTFESLANAYATLFANQQAQRQIRRQLRSELRGLRNSVAANEQILTEHAINPSLHPDLDVEAVWADITSKEVQIDNILAQSGAIRENIIVLTSQLASTLRQLRSEAPEVIVPVLPAVQSSTDNPALTVSGLTVNGDITYTGSLIRW